MSMFDEPGMAPGPLDPSPHLEGVSENGNGPHIDEIEMPVSLEDQILATGRVATIALATAGAALALVLFLYLTRK